MYFYCEYTVVFFPEVAAVCKHTSAASTSSDRLHQNATQTIRPILRELICDDLFKDSPSLVLRYSIYLCGFNFYVYSDIANSKCHLKWR